MFVFTIEQQEGIELSSRKVDISIAVVNARHWTAAHSELSGVRIVLSMNRCHTAPLPGGLSNARAVLAETPSARSAVMDLERAWKLFPMHPGCSRFEGRSRLPRHFPAEL